MIRAQVLIVGGVPHLHVTRPGGPAETRPMGQAEVVRLLAEAAHAVLATGAFCAQVGDLFPDVGNVIEDDPPPHFLGLIDG